MTDTTFSWNPDTEIPPLDGKVILITGANTGLGKRSALELAKHSPAHIFMTARDSTKGNAAAEEVRAAASEGTKISFIEMDLASFDSIKKATAEFLAASKRLDILILNAGILGAPAGLTKDGYEITMGTNHLGHALLLKLLFGTLTNTTLMSSSKARVVSLSSVGYKFLDPPTIRIDDLRTPDSGGLDSMKRYMQSKLANILYARQFAQHNQHFTTVVIHPGEVKTELYSREPGDDFVKYLQTEIAPTVAFDIEQGVKNQLWAATAKEGVVNGEYYEPVGESGKLLEAGKNDELGKRLWEWTQTQLGGHTV